MAIEVFVRCLAKRSETQSGDAFWYAEMGDHVWMVVVDGLGSGPEAARASRAAVDHIRTRLGEVEALDPAERPQPMRLLDDLLQSCDAALRGTRGAAVGVALLHAPSREGWYAGVGNIEMRLVGERSGHPVGVPGIVGAGLRKVRTQPFAYQPGDLAIMHSDGLSSRFDLDPSGVRAQGLEAIGEALVSEHGRSHDDVTLILLRQYD